MGGVCADRIEALVDPLSAFVEVGALAAEAVYDFELPAAGIVCGIGTVRGQASFSFGVDTPQGAIRQSG